MDKKSDHPGIHAAPAPTADREVPSDLPYVPAGILRRARETGGSEPSPAAAEPLPAAAWPRVDEYLDEPDETDRWERIGGEKKWAFPATRKHGDPHFLLDKVLGHYLAEGFVGSVDLKTRVDDKQEYASDTCVRRKGIDPETGGRYLESLVFEVAYKRSAKDTRLRAEGFARHGVERQIAIFPDKLQVSEWSKSEKNWMPLAADGHIEDPCLVRPLPIAALFDGALAEIEVARVLEAKDNPAILEMKAESEKRGFARGLANSVLLNLSARGIEVPGDVQERIRATTRTETLERWLLRAVSASSLEDVFEV